MLNAWISAFVGMAHGQVAAPIDVPHSDAHLKCHASYGGLPSSPPTPTDSSCSFSSSELPGDIPSGTDSMSSLTSVSSEEAPMTQQQPQQDGCKQAQPQPQPAPAHAVMLPQPCPSASTLHAPLLPPQVGPVRKTLVLDLDRTLIDCIMLREPSISEPDFVYTDELGVQAKVWSRPFLAQFLKSAARDFEVVLFTAAGARHADAVLRTIDADCSLFQHRLYGQHTVDAPLWGWVKDLSRLGRPLSSTLLVDDSVLAALNQPCNLVPIRPFDQANPHKDQDTALLELLRFLQDKVLPAKDVREAIAAHWDKIARRPRRRPLRLPSAPTSLQSSQHGHQAHAAQHACTCSCHVAASAAGDALLYMAQASGHSGVPAYTCAAARAGCGCASPNGSAMLAHAYQDWSATDDEPESSSGDSAYSQSGDSMHNNCACCSPRIAVSSSAPTGSGLAGLMSQPKGLHRSPALSHLFAAAAPCGGSAEQQQAQAEAAAPAPTTTSPPVRSASFRRCLADAEAQQLVSAQVERVDALDHALGREPSRDIEVFVLGVCEDLANNDACWYSGSDPAHADSRRPKSSHKGQHCRTRSLCGLSGVGVPQHPCAPLRASDSAVPGPLEATVRGGRKAKGKPPLPPAAQACNSFC